MKGVAINNDPETGAVILPCDVEPPWTPHPDVNGPPRQWHRPVTDNGQPDETPIRDMFEADYMQVPTPLPDSNPKTAYGVKKPPVFSTVPASALLVEGQVMALGASKYGPFNWRSNSVAATVYIDAAVRHLLAWNAGQDDDPESGVSHLGHVRACMGILIDALETGNLIDDRPKDKATPALIERFTRK